MSRAGTTHLRRRNSCSGLALIYSCRVYWEGGPFGGPDPEFAEIYYHLVQSCWPELQRHNSFWKIVCNWFDYKGAEQSNHFGAMKFYVAPCTPGLKSLRRCSSASVASCISSHCWAFSVIWLSRMHIIHINPQEVVDPKAMRSNPQKVTILWGQRGTLIADCVYAPHFLFSFLWLGWVRNHLVHRGFLW